MTLHLVVLSSTAGTLAASGSTYRLYNGELLRAESSQHNSRETVAEQARFGAAQETAAGPATVRESAPGPVAAISAPAELRRTLSAAGLQLAPVQLSPPPARDADAVSAGRRIVALQQQLREAARQSGPPGSRHCCDRWLVPGIPQAFASWGQSCRFKACHKMNGGAWHGRDMCWHACSLR